MLGLKTKLKLFYNRYCWRRINHHNSTIANNLFHLSSVTVGRYSYGPLNIIDSNPISKLRIGDFCSIGPNVTFILNSEHYTNRLSSFPFKVMCLHSCNAEAISNGDITIDDDVWIGYGATILSGVHIGQGAIVAAGAVVSKNVPPYSIVGGVPANVIKYRFSKEVISYLLKLDYKRLTESLVSDKIELLYTQLDNLTLSEIKKMFEWFPKKII